MKKVLGRIFWVIVILLMCLWTFEFYRVRNGHKPLTCIVNNTRMYYDGETTECIGLGFKVYDYQRSNLYGTEFVSIFAHERKEEADNYTSYGQSSNTNDETPVESE